MAETTCAFLILFFSSAAGGALCPNRLSSLLDRNDRPAVVRLIRENRKAAKRCFARLLREILDGRKRGSGTAKLEKKASFLADVFKREGNEPHLAAFLAEALSWNPEKIDLKSRIDRAYLEAESLRRKGLLRKALEILSPLPALSRSVPYTKGEAASGILLGKILWSLGREKEAEKSLKEALKAAQRVKYRRYMCAALSALGAIYLREARYREAADAFSAYRRLCEETGDEAGVSRALANLAQVALEAGDADKASALYEKALSLPGRDRSQEGTFHLGLGRVYSRSRDYLSAFREFEKALSLASGDALRAAALVNLGALWRKQGDNDRAREAYLTALEIERRLNRPHRIAAVLNNLAVIDAAEGRSKEARKRFEKALEIQKRVNNLSSVGRILANLCVLSWKSGDEKEGERLYAEAVRVLERVEDRATRAGLAAERGFRNLSEKRYDSALRSFESARNLYLQVRDFQGLALSEIGLGKTYSRLGKTEKAIAFFRNAVEKLERQREKASSARYRDLFFNRQELIDAFANRIVEIKPGGEIVDFKGNYEEYAEFIGETATV